MKNIFILLILIIFCFSSLAQALPKLEKLDYTFRNPNVTMRDLISHKAEKAYLPADMSQYKFWGVQVSSPIYFRKNAGNVTGEAFQGLGPVQDPSKSSSLTRSLLTSIIPLSFSLGSDDLKSNSQLQSAMADNPEAFGYLHEYDNSRGACPYINFTQSVFAFGAGVGALMMIFGSSSGGQVTAVCATVTLVTTIVSMYYNNHTLGILDKAIDTYNK